MIILSQDKTKIWNFDNIEVMEIVNPLENNDGKFKILVNKFSIAEYATEERAKEVLKMFYEYYSRVNYKDGVSFEKGLLTILAVKNGLFYMPEE